MSRKAVEILKESRQMPGANHKLRVAAYCRVSTKHEEQLRSLEAQIGYYTNYIQNHSNLGIGCCVFRCSIRYSHQSAPWLSETHGRLHQWKSGLDFGEVSQPFWPGYVGNHSSNQEVEENEYWSLHRKWRTEHLEYQR